MANTPQVSFEITANTKKAIQAANDLVRELTKAAEKADFGNAKINGLPGTLKDAAKSAATAQKEFSTFNIELQRMADLEKELKQINRSKSAQQGVVTRAENAKADALIRAQQNEGKTSKSGKAEYAKALEDLEKADTKIANANAKIAELDTRAEKVATSMSTIYTRVENMESAANKVVADYGAWQKKAEELTSNIEGAAKAEEQFEQTANEANKAVNEQTDASKAFNDATNERNTKEGEPFDLDKINESNNEILQLVAKIYTLRATGSDATATFQKLIDVLTGLKAGTADAAELDAFIKDIGAATTLITKNLKHTDEMDDVFNALVSAVEPAKKALSDTRAEFRETGLTAKTTAERISEVKNTVSAITSAPADPGNIAELLNQYDELARAKKQMDEMGRPAELHSTYATTLQVMAQLNSQIKAYQRNLTGVESANVKAKKSTDTFNHTLRNLNSILKFIKTGFTSLKRSSNGVKSSFDSMTKSMRSNFKHLLTNITKYVFGFRSLFFLVRRLRQQIIEGFKDLARWNDGNNEINHSLTELRTSLLYLRNAWTSAFSPIVTAITPWLSLLLDKLAEVGNAVAKFIGVLTGQEVVFNAVKVDAGDYAESLDNAAGSAGSAADKTKKLTDRLAAFDDLNVLGVDNDPDGSGSGGGGGGADAYVPDPNEMFKLVDAQSRLADLIKLSWEQADFSVLGELIKNKIMTSLENIKWDEVHDDVRRVMSSLGTFIVGLFGDPKFWEDLGEFGAGLFNAIIYGVQAFLETTKDTKFGEMIANGINKLLTETDWEQAGLDVNELGNQILDNLIDFFNTMDAEKASAAITAFLEKANIPQLAVKVGELTISAGGFLVTTAGMSLGDLLWDWVNQDGTSGIVMTKDGVEIPFKLNFFDSFWGDGAFQYMVNKSPLLALIVKILEGPIEWLVSVGLELSGKYMDSETVQDFLDIFTGKYDFSNLFSDSGTNEFNSTMHNFNEQMDGASTKSKDTYDKIWENTEGVKGAFSSLKDSLATTWSNTAADADTYWTNIKNNITDAVTTAKTTVSNKVTEWRTNLSQAWSNIKSDATSNFETMKSTIIETFEGLRDGIKNIINNGILPTVENMINFLIDGINSLIDKLNAFPDIEITNIFNGQTVDLGFSIPNLNHISIPRLAQGAVIPPNREFMAVLGDQSHGTNIEAPLDTIKQAVAEVMANNGNAEMIQLLQQLIAVVESKELNVGDKEIGQANARYTQRQNRIRGVSF